MAEVNSRYYSAANRDDDQDPKKPLPNQRGRSHYIERYKPRPGQNEKDNDRRASNMKDLPGSLSTNEGRMIIKRKFSTNREENRKIHSTNEARTIAKRRLSDQISSGKGVLYNDEAAGMGSDCYEPYQTPPRSAAGSLVQHGVRSISRLTPHSRVKLHIGDGQASRKLKFRIDCSKEKTLAKGKAKLMADEGVGMGIRPTRKGKSVAATKVVFLPPWFKEPGICKSLGSLLGSQQTTISGVQFCTVCNGRQRREYELLESFLQLTDVIHKDAVVSKGNASGRMLNAEDYLDDCPFKTCGAKRSMLYAMPQTESMIDWAFLAFSYQVKFLTRETLARYLKSIGQPQGVLDRVIYLVYRAVHDQFSA